MPEKDVDLSQLHEQWHPVGRYYEPGQGEIEVDGRSCDYKVHEFDLQNGVPYRTDNENVSAEVLEGLIQEGRTQGFRAVRDGKDTSKQLVFPTSKRIVTEVSPDLDEESDLTVIVCPGWGETTAQFEHDFLLAELREADNAGYENPRIIGLNGVGRGSKEYGDKSNRCSNVGMMDEVEDVEFLTKLLAARGHIGERVVIVGHSMGYMNAMGVANALDDLNQVREQNDNIRRQVQSIVPLMPFTDQPFGCLRSGRFVWTVRKQIIPATKQFMSGSGSLALPYDDHSRIMFAGGIDKSLGREHWLRGNPDSATRFVQAALNGKRRFDPDTMLEETRFHIFGGHKDELIPRKMVLNCADHLDGAAGTVGGSLEFGMDFSHSLPLELSSAQMAQISGLLCRAFRA